MLKKLFHLKLIFLILIFVFSFLGCKSSPVKDATEGYQLSTKARVTDKKTNSSYNVDILISVVPNKATRLDVTALLGYQVAEMVMNPQQIQYIQRENKFFVQGPFKSQVLKPLFRQAIDPKLFWSLAHEEWFSDGVYYGAEVKSEIQPKSSKGFSPRKITIENSAFKMIWLFKSKAQVTLSYYETFVLVKPEDYKLINIK